MTATFIQNERVQLLYGLQPGKTFEEEFSVVSVESILFDVFSIAIWVLEGSFDQFRKQLDALILANKHGKLEWYITTALNYRHGFALNNFGEYTDGSATPEDIASSKIIANVAFEKAVINGHGVIRCKVVKEESGVYKQLDTSELTGFSSYMNKKTLFGLSIICLSRPADVLRVQMKIWYDPLVIDSTGARLDGTDDAPVVTAIVNYLQSLEFNGEFVAMRMIDSLQAVEGIEIAKLVQSYGAPSFQLSQMSEENGNVIDEIYQSFAGWMVLDVPNSTFEYIPR